ncbi:regulator of chromosome condensation 1/beta-lactamase-inhibitor protein II [Massariosphaeria phaeospora]|uniref:Regulator of chromosome condensation 1/beta-lactamase-inhibitor protein II n=1 Tax=Massariosphaeria phaeospora TaxID=100035 RepID=A0A7C8MAF3_9PLEO|nr:regulator of chromosome condensation 1/beta-lactamase-inhibitor protein II [Massariosphaeria phaeospora]
MADKISSITDLPLDVLVLIFPYLDAKSFLAFCSTCKAFQQPSIRLDPAYWSYAAQSVFRVPNQPVIQYDGMRWHNLYRRMLTQSRVFTWGNNEHYRLGHKHVATGIRGPIRRRDHCSFPAEMERTRELGVIADMQCGGWSTTLLTSRGALYTAGVLDGMRIIHDSNSDDGPQPLRFPNPVGYPYSLAPETAIRQFSSGRSHILGLSDSGKIWSWYDVQKPALQIKFINIDLKEALHLEPETRAPSLYGHVKHVIAGWSCSSAYIYGTGIVLWDPVHRSGDPSETVDTMLVLDTAEVPKTGYQRVKGASRESEESNLLAEEVGAVLNYIVLEHFVVFVTDIGKVFCAKLGEKNKVDEILELRALRNNNKTPLDVQGSFRRFAVFKNGEVITTEQEYLDLCWDARHSDTEQTDIEGLKRIPALQHNGVISVAFADFHFLALHSTGKITSYGTELQCCGALGLGGDREIEGQLRGITYIRGWPREAKLLPHAYTHGRQVWFEQEKKDWISFLANGCKDLDEAKERLRLISMDVNVQGEVSEWIEQEGNWDQDQGEDGLGSYFALGISAAGWHSGALVLVNDELVEKNKGRYVWADKSFPRLVLKDGREMPGTVPFDEWRHGRPEWNSEV